MQTSLNRLAAAATAALLLGSGLAVANQSTAGATRPDAMTLLSTGHQVPYLDHGAWMSKRGGGLNSGLGGSYGSGPLYAHGAAPETELGTPKVYVIYWGSQWGTQGSDGSGNDSFTGDAAGMAPRLEQLFKGIGGAGETWSGVLTQYCDGVSSGTTTCPAGVSHVGAPLSSGVLSGVWYDNASAAPTGATNSQIAQEALNGAAHFGNTTTSQSTQYVVVSPTGTHPGGYNTPSGGFCAWHSYATSTTGFGFAYTNLPYLPDMGASCGANYVNAGAAGSLDGVTIVEGHEYAETLSDLSAAGGWLDSQGYENGDKCAWNGAGSSAWNAQDVTFGTGSFAMQATWSNAAGGCQISGPYWSNAPSDFSIAASPTSVTASAGTKATTVISTALTLGNSQTVALSASGLPTAATASFSPSSVATGSSSTLTISTSASIPVGSYTVSVAGTAGSGTHTVQVQLNVTQAVANNFSLSLSPTSGTATRGGSSTSSTVKTATTSGSAQTLSLSVSGAPSGVTSRLSSSSLTSGGSTTLRLSASSRTAVGTYTITVTAKASSGSHTATYTLTVK